MRLVLVIVGGFATTRRAGLRTRLHVSDAEARRFRDIDVTLPAALLLGYLVAIDVSVDDAASRDSY